MDDQSPLPTFSLVTCPVRTRAAERYELLAQPLHENCPRVAFNCVTQPVSIELGNSAGIHDAESIIFDFVRQLSLGFLSLGFLSLGLPENYVRRLLRNSK